ncbi:hypothetical protein [Aurantibacillus circumpalustris]|nr:hypothetical protein [Aurantibacillus circumpalustris]
MDKQKTAQIRQTLAASIVVTKKYQIDELKFKDGGEVEQNM